MNTIDMDRKFLNTLNEFEKIRTHPAFFDLQVQCERLKDENQRLKDVIEELKKKKE